MTQEKLIETLDKAEEAVVRISDALMVVWTCLRIIRTSVPRLPKALFSST
jgi:hypothetical protein